MFPLSERRCRDTRECVPCLSGLHQRDRHRPLLLHHPHCHSSKDEGQSLAFQPPPFPASRRPQAFVLLDRSSSVCPPALSGKEEVSSSAQALQNDSPKARQMPAEGVQGTSGKTASREAEEGSTNRDVKMRQEQHTDNGLSTSSGGRAGERARGEEGKGTAGTPPENDHGKEEGGDELRKEATQEDGGSRWRVTREEMEEAVGLHRDEVLIMQGERAVLSPSSAFSWCLVFPSAAGF